MRAEGRRLSPAARGAGGASLCEGPAWQGGTGQGKESGRGSLPLRLSASPPPLPSPAGSSRAPLRLGPHLQWGGHRLRPTTRPSPRLFGQQSFDRSGHVHSLRNRPQLLSCRGQRSPGDKHTHTASSPGLETEHKWLGMWASGFISELLSPAWLLPAVRPGCPVPQFPQIPH